MIGVIIIYVFMAIIIAIIQCFFIEIIKFTKKIFIKYRFPYYILISSTLFILFFDFYFCSLLWAGVLYSLGVFETFNDCISYAIDSFSTLGSSEISKSPWAFSGPIISMIGISTIAFITTSAFSIIQIENQNIFERII